MSVTIAQRGVGQSAVRWSGKDGSLDFIIKGTTDKTTAYNTLITDGSVPTTVGTFSRVDADCNVEEIADGIWLGHAIYALPSYSTQAQNTFSIQFDISGTTTKYTQSLKTRDMKASNAATAVGETPRDFGGLIGVNSDGSIEGVDVYTPTLSYQVNYTFPSSKITNAYIGTLYRTVGKTNSSPFSGFKPGELLMTKAVGQRRDANNWDLSFAFATSENKTNVIVNCPKGDKIVIPTKKGWDYLWVYNEEREITYGSGDTAKKYLQKVPLYAYVEQVYDEANYALLGINGL